MILAGIDIGTNTLRLLIAETDRNTFREIHSDRRITRLGTGLDRTGVIDPTAEARSLEALDDFMKCIQSRGVRHIAAIGTSALRKAANADAFIERAKRKTGISITVVSGDEEARLTLLGVTQSLKDGEAVEGNFALNRAILDIGGGSTEIIIARRDRATLRRSLPLGAVYFTERFLPDDPPDQGNIDRLKNTIRTELARCGSEMRSARPDMLIGTAGTITTLASISLGLAAYDPARINGAVLTREFVDDIVTRLSRMTLKERAGIRGLEKGREDIILAGAVIVRELMEWFGFPGMLVSDGGLREGIVLDLAGKIKNNRGTAKEE